MAVRAQYPCNSALSPDFLSRAQCDAFHDQLHMLGDYINAGTAVSERRRKSELTCNNSSAPRKRSRGDDPSTSSMALPHHLQHPIHSVQPMPVLNAPQAQTGPSTSGRIGGLAEELVARACHQSLEVDTLIRFQMDRLRSGIFEMKRQHCGVLVSAVEQRLSKRLKEKETELEIATRRNAELEEKVRQLCTDNQVWFNAVKNSEAFASSLRAALTHLLLQSAPPPPADVSVPAAEGYGADDTQSRCFGTDGGQPGHDRDVARREKEELRRRRACTVCGEMEVSVLLLPCRHLCLCMDCVPRLDTCPVCNATKIASINVCTT